MLVLMLKSSIHSNPAAIQTADENGISAAYIDLQWYECINRCFDDVDSTVTIQVERVLWSGYWWYAQSNEWFCCLWSWCD